MEINTLLKRIFLIMYSVFTVCVTSALLITTAPASLFGKEPRKIMLLGDSITQGDRNHNSYRRNLWQKLRAGRYNVDFVGSERKNYQGNPLNPDFDLDHEGHWGWRADQILRMIDDWASTYQPDIVLIHLGHNDLFQGNSISSTTNELGNIIDILRKHNPNVIVLLAQLIPAKYALNRKIQKLNAEIRKLAESKNTSESPIIIVNHWDGFDADVDTYDGVHPNESGEEKMAVRWYAALVRVLGKVQN